MNLLDLPDVVLNEIFGYLTYDEIAKKRLVSRRFNELCQQLLNSGFNKAIRQHTELFRRIRNILPRRESERRRHNLARHAEVLHSLDTRISMLSMTYSKYIDRHFCCFIPGKVLDEILRVVKLIGSTKDYLRPHVVLQELRDLSSMAIEHFDENIVEQFNVILMARTAAPNSDTTQQQPRQALPASGLGEITFSGMNSDQSEDRSNSCGQRAISDGPSSTFPETASASTSSYYQYQQQQPAQGMSAGHNFNSSSYYEQSPDELIRQRINYLLYLPRGELLRHLNAIPYAELNPNYYDYYYNSTSRGALDCLNFNK